MKLLIIEDCPSTVSSLSRMFSRSGYTTQSVPDFANALRVLREHVFDVILLDLGLADSSGLATLYAVKALTRTPVVVLTGGKFNGADLVEAGASDVLFKHTMQPEQLQERVDYAAARARRSQDFDQALLNAANAISAFTREILYAPHVSHTPNEDKKP